MAFLKLFQLISDVLGGELLGIPSSSFSYLFPIATGAMVIRIVINSEVAIIFAVLSQASFQRSSWGINSSFFSLLS